MRYSATKDPALHEAEEGLIDPALRTISFWNGERKLAVLHYYATHPMSYYGAGIVSCDFVGIARQRRTEEDAVPHLYFTGCGGNVTAGKYNDGSPEKRTLLAGRIHAAMVAAEAAAQRQPLQRIDWRLEPITLRPRIDFVEPLLLKELADSAKPPRERIGAALRAAYVRHASHTPIPLTALHLNDSVRVLHLPGESFVEYQLFAQAQAKDAFVAVAAYGDCGPGYIPLAQSFAEGGYEPTEANAEPATEDVLKQSMVRVLMR